MTITNKPITPIRNQSALESALLEASELIDLDPELGTPESDRLEVLAVLIEDYERKHFPIGPSDPISAIEFRMEQGNLTPKDLVPSIGNLNRVYEILNGKRSLSMNMIRNLNKNLGIPIESLIG